MKQINDDHMGFDQLLQYCLNGPNNRCSYDGYVYVAWDMPSPPQKRFVV